MHSCEREIIPLGQFRHQVGHLCQLLRFLAGECTLGKPEPAIIFSAPLHPELEAEEEGKAMARLSSRQARTLLSQLQISLMEAQDPQQAEMPLEPS